MSQNSKGFTPHHKGAGFTLVELVISILIISVAFYSLINVFSLVAGKSADSRVYTIARYLAQGKMAEWIVRGRNYYPEDLPSPPVVKEWTSFSDIGGDLFKEFLNYSAEAADYQYQVKIEYVHKNTNPIQTKDYDQGTITDMRKLTVEVRKMDGENVVYLKSFSTLLPSKLELL